MQYLVDLDLIEADHNSLIVNKFILSTFPPLYIVTCKCTLCALSNLSSLLFLPFSPPSLPPSPPSLFLTLSVCELLLQACITGWTRSSPSLQSLPLALEATEEENILQAESNCSKLNGLYLVLEDRNKKIATNQQFKKSGGSYNFSYK